MSRLKSLKDFLSNQKIITVILIALLVSGLAWYFFTRDTRPEIIQHYSATIKEISKSERLQELRNYAKFNLSDPIDGKSWEELLAWESKYLRYPFGDENDILNADRREMPIDIVSLDHSGYGRCGEFSLLYYGLCKVNGIPVRLIVDNSMLINTSKSGADDHMWNEININGTWMHIDPTQVSYFIQSSIKDYSAWINNPKAYVLLWNKDVNEVWSITDTEVFLITDKYREG